MTTVSIGRLRVRLQTQEHHADRLQNRCSTWFRSRLARELDGLLTAHAGSDVVPQTVDRWVIRVGDIPLSRFEAEMSARILTQLQRQLLTLSVSEQAVSVRAGSARVTPSGAGPAETTRGAVASTEADGFAQLLRYLDTGLAGDVRQWLSGPSRDTWLQEALDEAPPFAPCAGRAGKTVPPRIALALRILHPRARGRLVTTWSGHALARLGTWLIAPARLPDMTPSEATWMLPLAALVALQHHPVDTDFAVGGPEGPVSQAALPVGLRDAGAPVFGATVSQAREATGRVRAVEPQPDPWFETLLHSLWPVALRAPLLGWLCDPAHAQTLTPRLEGLSLPARRQLLVRLGVRGQRRQDNAPSALDEANGLRTSPGAEGQAALPAARQPLGARALEDARGPLTALGVEKQTALPATRQPLGARALEDTRGPLTSLGVEKPANVRQGPSAQDAEAPWMVANAGLVLLWPLLPRLFGTFGWLDEGHFVDEQAQWQALGCLDWLAWGEPELAEWRTPCTRLLCGIAWDAPFEACPPSSLRQAELDTWLSQALASVPMLARCSAGDLRAFFLQRTGMLVDTPLALTIAPEAPDVLLRHLPWPLTTVMLPWLTTPLRVDWN